jgi:hypothetical protein
LNGSQINYNYIYIIYELFCISSIYPAVIMPAGRATTAIPKTDDNIVIICPAVDTG